MSPMMSSVPSVSQHITSS